MSSPPRYLVRKGRASVPAPTPIADALRGHNALNRLGQGLQDARRRFEAIAPALPAALAAQLQPGQVDDDGWTLMAANSAVAAKLRQLLPRLEERLHKADLHPARIRVRLLQR